MLVIRAAGIGKAGDRLFCQSADRRYILPNLPADLLVGNVRQDGVSQRVGRHFKGGVKIPHLPRVHPRKIDGKAAVAAMLYLVEGAGIQIEGGL